jgi:hypothetical protein
MSCDICFAVSHAPCDHLFPSLRTETSNLFSGRRCECDINMPKDFYLCFSSTCRGRWQPVQATLLFVERVLTLAERGQLFSTSARGMFLTHVWYDIAFVL